jgi:nicotinamidase-related amidase
MRKSLQFSVPVRYYSRETVAFDDPVPARGFRGHTEKRLFVSTADTVIACMHCMNYGFPGGRQWSPDSPDAAVTGRIESIPRMKEIIEKRIAPLLAVARSVGLPVIHLIGGCEQVAQRYPQYSAIAQRVEEQVKVPLARCPKECRDEIQRDIFGEAFLSPPASPAVVDIAPPLKPHPRDWIVTTTRQATTILSENEISNILYSGFSTGGCVMFAAGGVCDMVGLGYRGVILRDCTTDQETAETAEDELITRCALLAAEQYWCYSADSSELLGAIESAQGEQAP